ncbi:sugar ABC transporter substrate-binding protein [Bacillus infantis]|uniref:sugar ABC transporter substrate-binding protein n=1 Tax=Bacillus infantis TaxID=324767 RepID=UPI003CE7F077
MRKLYLIVLFISLGVSLGLMIDLFAKLNKPLEGSSESSQKDQFAVIIPKANEYRWELLINGIERASKKQNTDIEVMEARDADEQLDLLNTAIYSKKKGIIIYPMGEEGYERPINKAISKGIPVITILADVPTSKRNSFIGESIQSSSLAASEFISATDGRANIALVVSDLSSSMNQERLAGVKKGLQGSPEINLLLTEEIPADLILATSRVEQILKNNKYIDAVIGIDSTSTIATAKAAINLKRGQFTTLGFDAPSNLLNYIDEGVVYGTIMQDTDFIGFVAARYLRDINRGRWVPKKLNADIRFITKENVRKLVIEKSKRQER